MGLVLLAIIHARAYSLAKRERRTAISLMAVAGDPQAAMESGK